VSISFAMGRVCEEQMQAVIALVWTWFVRRRWCGAGMAMVGGWEGPGQRMGRRWFARAAAKKRAAVCIRRMICVR
jgi:hypothetical protein